VKRLIFLFGYLLILIYPSVSQINKLKTSYELSNSPQWLKIPGGFASFAQIDYNNDGLDDVLQFEGYDTRVPYTWPGPFFFRNSSNGLIEDNIQLNNRKLFAGKTLVADLNGDGLLDAFLLTGMDPAGCTNCPDPVFPLYSMLNLNGKSFKVDSITYYGVWRNGTAGDIDNDGDIDVLAFSTHHKYTNKIFNRMLINDGKGNFMYQPSNLDSIGWVDRVELIDMNKDNYLDIVMNDVYSPTNLYANRFRILWNDGKGNFNQNNSLTISIPNDLYVLDINAYDIDNDGFKEVILPMNDANSNWRILIFKSTDNKNFTNISNTMIENATFFNSPIWDEPISVFDLDNNGRVDIMVNDRNKNLRWEWNGSKLVRNNCNFSIKPKFNNSNYSFCSGDSIKISITNINQGDTLKWYFGTKSDLTNVSNKTFTDSSSLYVTRTDSLGCMISSDTIHIKKYSIPSSPLLSRDADNNLVSNSTGNIWYKDGIKIADTTQKIKPAANGLYSATTTQNGCTSKLSQGYYYFVNSISNLTNGEYFKISPNPTSSEIKVDFQTNSNTELIFSLTDLNGRSIITNKKIKTNQKINLNTIPAGNYVVTIKEKDGRLILNQQIVKQ
jgi:hypothetical protein